LTEHADGQLLRVRRIENSADALHEQGPSRLQPGRTMANRIRPNICGSVNGPYTRFARRCGAPCTEAGWDPMSVSLGGP
jgi:hypothetical protein